MNDLRVLSIGSDRNLFKEGSDVSNRIKEYGTLVDELHIVVFALSKLGLKEKQIAPNVWVYPTNSFSRIFYIWDATRLGKDLVFKQKFVRGKSLITTQDPFESGLVGLNIKHKWRIPLEVQLHTDPFSQHFKGFLNGIRKKIVYKVLPGADSLRVVNKSLADKINSLKILNTQNISILPIYIDKEKIQMQKISFDVHARYGWGFVILSVARLTKEKNLGLAIRVLKRVREQFPDTGLLILGEGPERKNLESLAHSLKQEFNVSFPGWDENTASYYQSSDLYLQTSFFEGYGLSLVEAGLSGLPVVTTKVGVAEELTNGKDAFICESNDEESLVMAVLSLIKNPELQDTIKSNFKNSLESKLINKETFLLKIIENWNNTASKI